MSIKNHDFGDTQTQIGQSIMAVLHEQRRSVSWLARQVPCDRSNIYNIFRRDDINTGLLRRISVILGHDFFADMSDAYQQYCNKKSDGNWGGGKNSRPQSPWLRLTFPWCL